MNYQDLSLQELFDISYNHIIKQGFPSVNDKDECLYRGYDGIMCAAGVFLSDDEVVEGRPWLNLIEGRGDEPNGKDLFIKELQNCHDINAIEDNFIDLYKESMRELAGTYNLVFKDVIKND